MTPSKKKARITAAKLVRPGTLLGLVATILAANAVEMRPNNKKGRYITRTAPSLALI